MKPNATERDQWRSVEFLAERLHSVSAMPAGGNAPTAEALLRPLVKELRFPSVGDR